MILYLHKKQKQARKTIKISFTKRETALGG